MIGLRMLKRESGVHKDLSPAIRGWVVDLAMMIFFFLATAAFYWRIITPDLANRASFPKGDFMEQFYAFAYFRAQEILDGRLPLWNPHANAGHPFIADIQSAVFYPVSLVTTLIAGRGYALYALEVEAVFHIFLAAAFTYAFGVVAFRSRFAAAISAVVFAFGGYLTSYPSQQLAILEVQVWLPLVLFFAHLATRSPVSLRSRLVCTVVGGLCLGVSALAGHPQAFMYVLDGTLLYLLFRLFELLRDQGKGGLLAALWILPLFVAIGLGLAAIQLVPTYEFMQVSSRAKLTYDFTSWGFPLQDILQIVLPGTVSPMSPMYVGVFPLALGALAIWGRRLRPVIFWALVALATFLLSFGGHTFLYSVFYVAFPGFSTFRDQERAIFLTSFALAQLAGYGALMLVDSRLSTQQIAKVARVLLLCCIGVLELFALASVIDFASGKLGNQLGVIAFLLIVLFLCFALVQARALGLSTPVFAVAAIGLVVFDLFSINWKNNLEERRPEDYYRSTPLIRYLQENVQKGRVFNEYQFPLNYGFVYGVEDIGGASPLIVERFRLLSKLPPERRWQLLNVRYLLTWQGGYVGGKKISAENNINLYELPEPLPRASVVYDARVEAKDEAALALLASGDFDPRSTVVLAEDPGIALPGPGTASSPATVSTPRPDKLVIETEMGRPGILLLSEVFYPGWKATVDGKPAKILRADLALRGVPLGAGKHTVEMLFDPGSVKLGAAITVTTLISSVILLVLVGRRPAKKLS